MSAVPKHWANPLAETPSDEALIILNEPIPSRETLQRLWARTSYRVCADGGANRLHDVLVNNAERKRHLPDVVTGDFDSLRAEVKEFYAGEGSVIIQDGDQYATDLQKSFKAIAKFRPEIKTILLLGGLTGRLDQTIHTLHFLTKMRQSDFTIWAFSEQSMACVIDKGSHVMQVDQQLQGPTCGLLPVGCDSARITTKGLEWDIENWETSFDTQISTSNHIKSDKIHIQTDKALVWTVELRGEGCQQSYTP